MHFRFKAKNTVRILKEEYPDAFKVMPPTEPEKLPAQGKIKFTWSSYIKGAPGPTQNE